MFCGKKNKYETEIEELKKQIGSNESFIGEQADTILTMQRSLDKASRLLSEASKHEKELQDKLDILEKEREDLSNYCLNEGTPSVEEIKQIVQVLHKNDLQLENAKLNGIIEAQEKEIQRLRQEVCISKEQATQAREAMMAYGIRTNIMNCGVSLRTW